MRRTTNQPNGVMLNNANALYLRFCCRTYAMRRIKPTAYDQEEMRGLIMIPADPSVLCTMLELSQHRTKDLWKEKPEKDAY